MLLALVGCSSQVGPKVKGQVLLDSKPVAGARVTFEGKGGTIAVTDNEGKFFLDGKAFSTVQPGKYVVLVTKFVDKEGKDVSAEDYDQKVASGDAVNSLPAVYSTPEQNPLSAEIKDGMNELKPFELKSN
jgi:hypothetical protein